MVNLSRLSSKIGVVRIMIVKDNIPMDVNFRRVPEIAPSLGAPSSRKNRSSSSRYLFGFYAVIGVVAFSALVLTILLADSPRAVAFQSAAASLNSQDSSDPVQIGVPERLAKEASRLAPAAGDVSGNVPSPAPLQGGEAVVPPTLPPVAPSSPASPSSAPSSPAAAAVPSTEEGASAGVGVPVAPGSEGDDLYYDSLPLPPTGTMAKTAGPRKVDPVLEPAQKFVIVKKDHDSDAFESLIVSANRALVLGRYDSALDMFTQMYNKNPRDPRVLMGRASALQHLGRREAAIGAYDALLKIDPSNAEAQINKAGLAGVEYPAVALRTLLDLREKFPGNAGLSAQIGLMQARLGNDAEAFQYLGTAASLEPNNAEHIYNMAVIADRMGNVQKAIPLYEQALQMDGRDTRGERVSRDVIYARLSVLRASKK